MSKLKILKNDLTVSDLRYLALLHKDSLNGFIDAVNKSDIPVSVLNQAGDLESFYFNTVGLRAECDACC